MKLHINGLLIIHILSIRFSQPHECKYRYEQQYRGTLADCRGRHLSAVPTDLPRGLAALDLADNNILLLPTKAFEALNNLKYLSLNNNNISELSKTAFLGLENLTTLDIARNKLSSSNESFPQDLFRSLISLQTLNIEKNEMTSYPDWVFPPLINLQNLYMDSIQSPYFGPGFLHLTNLKFLQMDSHDLSGGRCVTIQLTNNTYNNLKNSPLETLVLNHCPIRSCQLDVFKPLTSLTSLEFSDNRVGVDKVLKLLHPFKGRHMKAILLNHVFIHSTSHLSSITHRSLTSRSMIFLKSICVSEFSMRSNKLIWMKLDSVIGYPFSNCMEKLDVSRNSFLGDVRSLFRISFFPKLRYLSLGYANSAFYPPVIETYNDFQANTLLPNVEISLPPNLEYLDVSGIGTGTSHHFIQLVLLNTSNLHIFNFSYNAISYLTQITGTENVTTVDMSGISFIDMKGVLGSFPGVKTLVLRHSNLKFPKIGTSSDFIFQNNCNLENIDLSFNKIRSYPNVPYPYHIVKMNISNNELDSISIKFEEFLMLKTLDLSYNLIGQITSDVRSTLDEVHFNQELLISLVGNPFVCGCENLDFILWLVHSPAIFESNRNYPCTKEDGTITGAENVALTFISINRQCNGKLTLSLTITFLAVLITFLVTSYFASKNLTRFHNTALKIFGLNVAFLSPADFDYKTYVGYCEADIPFVYQRLKLALETGSVRLFLKDREVLPGVDIADGIVEGINNSWKTLLVVSQDFLNDPWSNFTINTAVYSMTDLIPDRIVVLLVGDVQVKDLPESLLNAVDEEYIVHEDDFEQRPERMWRRIRKVLG